MRKKFIGALISCLFAVPAIANEKMGEKGWYFIDSEMKESGIGKDYRTEYHLQLIGQDESLFFRKINFRIEVYPHTIPWDPGAIRSTLIFSWRGREIFREIEKDFLGLSKLYEDPTGRLGIYKRPSPLFGWRFSDKETTLKAGNTHNEVLNCLTDKGYLSLEVMKDIRQKLSQYGLYINISYLEFRATLESLLPENYTFKELTQNLTRLLDEIKNPKHRQLLVWKIFQDVRQNQPQDISLCLWLLNNITIKELSFFEESERLKKELMAADPDSTLSSEERAFLDIEALIMLIESHPKEKESLKWQINSHVKWLLMKHSLYPQLPQTLGDIEVSKEYVLRSLFVINELLKENKKLQEKLLQKPPA